MPNISEFKKSKKQDKISKVANYEATDEATDDGTEASKGEFKAATGKPQEKRRPGRTPADGGSMKVTQGQKKSEDEKLKNETRIKVVEVEPMTDIQAETSSETNNGNSGDHSDSSEGAAKKSASAKIDINFPGSEVLRAKFPKSFETAEHVVSDWVNDGKFEEIPAVGHPLAKAALQQGLLKAKELEKKVMASPVTEKVTVQAFTYAMKAQNFVNQLRTKVNQKTKDRKASKSTESES